MKNYSADEMVISGLGVTSAVAQGKSAFIAALLQAKHNFAAMQRPGRQVPSAAGESGYYLGAEIPALTVPDTIAHSLLRTASFSGQVALATLHEAWGDANLAGVDPERIGLVIGGSNLQQRELLQTQEAFRNRVEFLRPTYGISFMDTDLCGLCSEAFNIQGMAYTLGGASASGQLAILQAIQAVQSGQVDVCIAMGALMDLSYWECQGFRALGAMGSDRYAAQPELACRPFDRDRDGFIFGESCGVVVVESAASARRAGVTPYARLAGWAMAADGNRNPNPSFNGEIKVIERALQQAQLSPADIDYINPHGTGSLIGDEIELRAIQHCQLSHAYINATKSIIGHGLTAAGAVEIIATVLQMQVGQLHPCRNLYNPIAPAYQWVQHHAIDHQINYALKLSMGFGGINSAVCLQKY